VSFWQSLRFHRFCIRVSIYVHFLTVLQDRGKNSTSNHKTLEEEDDFYTQVWLKKDRKRSLK